MPRTSHIKKFLATRYDDNHLANLLQQAQAGTLDAMDCDNCLLGLANQGYVLEKHFSFPIANLALAIAAEREFIRLGFGISPIPRKKRLNQKMIPLIWAEIERRAHVELHSDAQKSIPTTADQPENSYQCTQR
jgi:hypothetical protein